jgi:hypothetical protein
MRRVRQDAAAETGRLLRLLLLWLGTLSADPGETPFWRMIFFRKPVPTPHQVRGRLFRDHALDHRSA